jgi:uncharacterized protein (TIGR02145 family)
VKHLYFFGLFLFLPFFGFSQDEWNNWYFGNYAGITFNSGVPVAVQSNPMFQGSATVGASVSDSLGNILFFSSGLDIYNRNNMIMPNGSGLLGANGNSQSVLAVQNIVNRNQYYIFTVGHAPGAFGPIVGLYYSVLDMLLDAGLGDIVPGMKNIPLPMGDSAVAQLTAIRHQNNRDVWVVTLGHGKNGYYLAYLINSSGLQTVPIASKSYLNALIRNTPTHPVSNTNIRISPDGVHLVVTDSITQVSFFNSSTGIVTPRFTFNPGSYIGAGWGKEFSLDSRYLYVTVTESALGLSSIFQYSMNSQDSLSFMQSQVLVGDGAGLNIQMAPDWKIYLDNYHFNTDSLCVINNPSLPGTACNYQKNAFCLQGNAHNSCLPQFLQKYKAYIHHSNLCENNPVHFFGDIWPPEDSIHWNFGDPSSGAGNFSNLPNSSHIYQNTGTYTVELFVRHNDNRTDTSWQTITIAASPQVALGIDRIICIGDSVTFDAGACTGCTYVWKDLGSGLPVGNNQTFKTGLPGTYSVNVTNSNGCIGSDTVQLITTPVPSVTNNPLSKTICSGESTNIALTSSVPGTNFHWTASLTSGNVTGFSADSGLVINQTLINALPTPGIVTYHINPKIGSCIGNTVDYTVSVTQGTAVTISIMSSTNNVCQGTSVTFNAHTTYGGSSPIFQWKVNGVVSGLNDSIFTYTPANADVVNCTITSSNTVCISNNPATSNSITMDILQLQPVSVSVNALNPVCAGTLVTFTATSLNGGLSPIFQWKVNGTIQGANLSTYTYIPLNGDIITCTVLSNANCPTNNPATSPPLTMIVNPNLAVIVSISTPSNPFCLGSSVTFTATPSNGGVPIYQWQVNGVNAGTNSSTYTYTPAGGDVVTCVMNSSLICTMGNPATSNSITMIVNTGLPAGVTIVATQNPFCPGSSVTFTATPINGGTPVYQWKVNGINVGINSNTYTYNPVNNDSVRCIMTSNLLCVTGNPASSAKIIMSGTLAPIVTFTSCFDTITTINAKPIKLKGGIPLGGTYSGLGVNSVTGIYTPSLAGIGTHTITYTYTNAALCSATKSISILDLPSSILPCGTNLLDPRDNHVYPTVQIGSQCWLATNLNFGTTIASTQDQRDNCISEKYCYNDNPINCTNHGGLYQWDEVMRFDETPADQGFCPPGWHIPTENDWNTLFATFINNGFAGSPLKYSGYSGFNALLSGARHINKGWDFQGFATFFWSSTLRSDNKAWAHGMNDADPSVSVYPASRANAFSVRCLKD